MRRPSLRLILFLISLRFIAAIPARDSYMAYPAGSTAGYRKRVLSGCLQRIV
jgi:hypothetical protein